MPQTYSSKTIAKVLQRCGFIFIKQRGSHAKFRSISINPYTVIIPINRKSIPYGTFRAILQQAHITEEDFRNMLEKK